MQAAFEQFKANIARVRNLDAIYRGMTSRVTGVLDMSDILRAELVLAVSALDHYIHEVVRLGMLDIFQGNRTPTDAYDKFNISLKNIRDVIADNADFTWLDIEIRERHSWKSFQQADKISEALRLIVNVHVWEEVAAVHGIIPKDAKARLNLIVERRNKIAHEADLNPSFPGIRWDIDAAMVQEAVDYIEQIVTIIHSKL